MVGKINLNTRFSVAFCQIRTLLLMNELGPWRTKQEKALRKETSFIISQGVPRAAEYAERDGA
jgi:hypothetical protein